MEEQYKGQIFLEHANRAAIKIREINRLISGTESPEEGSLLGDIDYSIYIMIQMHFTHLLEKEISGDELNNMTTEIMFAEKDEIESIIGRDQKISVSEDK